MKNYLISNDTYAIVPTIQGSKIVNKYGSIFTDFTTKNLINLNCKYYGSSLDGRISGSRDMLGVSYKVPIIISESFKIIMFPTTSVRNVDCVWINIAAILFYKNKNNTVHITFKNDKKLIINISFGVFEKQLLRASRLESVFLARKD